MPVTPRRLIPLIGTACVALAVSLVAAPAQAAVAGGSAAGPLLAADYTSSQWGLSAVRAQEAWTVSRGTGTVVAVIDTGIDGGHPEFSGRLTPTGGVVNYDGASISVTDVTATDMTDSYGHGTHVSGIIAAADDATGTVGVAPEAKVLPVDVFAALNSSVTLQEAYAVLARAVSYARDNDARVISMSLGAPALERIEGLALSADDASLALAERTLCDAIAGAYLEGTVTVVAAGNDGDYTNYASMPGVCPTALVVSATGTDMRTTGWSSYDSVVGVAAPGNMILSTVPRSFREDYPYMMFSGTSMATPMVSGTLALVASLHPDYTAQQLIDAVESSATDLGPAGRDPRYGYGLLDAAAAVGAEASRGSVDPVAWLSTGIRPAVSYDMDKWTVMWNVPDAALLPDHYLIELADPDSDAALQTAEVPGNSVRYTFALAQNQTRVVARVSAVYGDGSVVLAAPDLIDSTAGFISVPDPANLKVTRTANRAVFTFDAPAADSNVKAMWVAVRGPGIRYEEKFVEPDEAGNWPASVSLRLAGTDPVNSDVEWMAANMVEADGWTYFSWPLDGKVVSTNAATLTEVTRAGSRHMHVSGMATTWTQKHKCTSNCEGRAMRLQTLSYEPYTAVVKGKKVTRWHWVKRSTVTYVDENGEFSALLAKSAKSRSVKARALLVGSQGTVARYSQWVRIR